MRNVHLKIKEKTTSYIDYYTFDLYNKTFFIVYQKKYFLGFISYWSKISKDFSYYTEAKLWMDHYPNSYLKDLEHNRRQKIEEFEKFNKVISKKELEKTKHGLSLTKDEK